MWVIEQQINGAWKVVHEETTQREAEAEFAALMAEYPNGPFRLRKK